MMTTVLVLLMVLVAEMEAMSATMMTTAMMEMATVTLTAP